MLLDFENCAILLCRCCGSTFATVSARKRSLGAALGGVAAGGACAAGHDEIVPYSLRRDRGKRWDRNGPGLADATSDTGRAVRSGQCKRYRRPKSWATPLRGSWAASDPRTKSVVGTSMGDPTPTIDFCEVLGRLRRFNIGVKRQLGSVSSSCENRTCKISLIVTLPLPSLSTRTSCCASGRPAGITIFPPFFN